MVFSFFFKSFCIVTTILKFAKFFVLDISRCLSAIQVNYLVYFLLMFTYIFFYSFAINIGVTVNCLCPGPVKTNIFRNAASCNRPFNI